VVSDLPEGRGVGTDRSTWALCDLSVSWVLDDDDREDRTEVPVMVIKVMGCSCEHQYQDKTKGKGRRIHNQTAKGWRCTVCREEKS